MMTPALKDDILIHAQAEYPKECCGVIVDGSYIPCTNLSEREDQFIIDPRDIAAVKGQISAYVHSHPDGSAEASEADKAQMLHHGLPWVIVGYPEGDFKVHEPDNVRIPLVGREYFHGLQDCYSLIRDYYSRELGIELGDYERDDAWWEDPEHPPLYADNFRNEGFVEVNEIQKHDILLCRLGKTAHVNHAVIFVGDGSLTSEEAEPVWGDSLILHHPYNRLSVREVFGSRWNDRAQFIIRHKSLL